MVRGVEITSRSRYSATSAVIESTVRTGRCQSQSRSTAESSTSLGMFVMEHGGPIRVDEEIRATTRTVHGQSLMAGT